MIAIGNYIGKRKSGISWQSYWATRTPSGLTAVPFSDSQVDLSLTENGTGFDGYSWERSEDNGVTYVEIGTTLITDIDTADTTFTEPKILKYRARAYKGINYSPYTSVVTVYPAGVRVSSVNTSVEVADAANEFYFNDGAGNDLPFSVLAIAKSNDLTVGNTLLSRGNASGLSYYFQINQTTAKIDCAIYGTDNPANVLYKAAFDDQDNLINKIVFTYSGNKSHTGIKIYKNGVEIAYNPASGDYGTYTNMNNRAGVNVGFNDYYPDNYGRNDIYTLLIANIELSQAQITEFQNMTEESDISSLSYYANLKLVDRFAGTLNSDVGSHNGTSVDSTYFFNNYMTDSVVENGTEYLPEVTETTFQSTFKNFKLGWIMSYGIETYSGNEKTWMAPVALADPALFNVASVDVAGWAAKAAESGKIDYAILTAWHIQGFSLFDHKTAVWRGKKTTVATVDLPGNNKYDVGLSTGDKKVLQKFVTEFNAVDIKPIIYVNTSASRNYYVDDDPDGLFHVGGMYENVLYQWYYNHLYMRERIQEICHLNPFAIWIDGGTYYPLTYLKDLYNAIKAINPEIGVLMNLWTEKDKTDNQHFPFDGNPVEELSREGILSSDAWWGLTQSYSGVTYPVTKDLTVCSRSDNEWFTNATPAALRSLVDLQALYDYAKAASVPCCMAVSPKPNGTIDIDQADLVGSIVL